MSASAESARAARVASITAEENRRRKRAEQLGLPWPRPYQRPTAGRPSRETHYTNALCSQVSKASDLSLVSKTRPPWWMRGKPLVPTAEDFVDVVAGIEVKEEEEKKNEETDEDEDDNKTEEQDQEKDESHEEGPPKKRLRAPLTTTPLQYKAWFVRFDAIQRKRFSCSTWLVGLLPADPSERLTLDLSIRSLRPLLCHWVRAANADVESKHSLWESAWRDTVAHPDIAEKVLTDAKARHELGKLFSRERNERPWSGCVVDRRGGGCWRGGALGTGAGEGSREAVERHRADVAPCGTSYRVRQGPRRAQARRASERAHVPDCFDKGTQPA